jgi:hypothetical protein
MNRFRSNWPQVTHGFTPRIYHVVLPHSYDVLQPYLFACSWLSGVKLHFHAGGKIATSLKLRYVYMVSDLVCLTPHRYTRTCKETHVSSFPFTLFHVMQLPGTSKAGSHQDPIADALGYAAGCVAWD